MKTIEKAFTLELTEREIEMVVTALHKEYKIKSKADANNPNVVKEYRGLRNALAGLVGITYMGEDA